MLIESATLREAAVCPGVIRLGINSSTIPTFHCHFVSVHKVASAEKDT